MVEMRIERKLIIQAERLLELINAEWQSDPMSLQHFDSRIVQEVREWLQDAAKHTGLPRSAEK